MRLLQFLGLVQCFLKKYECAASGSAPFYSLTEESHGQARGLTISPIRFVQATRRLSSLEQLAIV